MKNQNKFYQFKNVQLWKDGISLGFGIFGVVSAVTGILGFSFTGLFKDICMSIIMTIIVVISPYFVAVCFLWWNVRDRISIKIRGINVTICQGDIFEQNGWKVIGVDDSFTVTEDDSIISHSSLHGKLIKQLKIKKELEMFQNSISEKKLKLSQGDILPYKDFMLFALTHLNDKNEGHVDSMNYETLMRRMWQGIGSMYSGRPIYLPILGDGITRFDGVSEKPSSSQLLKCMLCSLKSSNVQIKSPITIVIYDRINEINFYDVKKFIS